MYPKYKNGIAKNLRSLEHMPERLLLAKMNRPSSLYPKQLVEKKTYHKIFVGS